MKIKFSKKFIKQYKKCPKNVLIAFRNRLDLFQRLRKHPLLKNHSLEGKYKGLRSINITGNYRALFKELDNGDIVFFIMIGIHSELYR